MGAAEEYSRRARESFEYLAAKQRRIAAATRDISLALEEALAAHRCDGFAGCWCVRGRAALTRLQEA